MIYREVPLPAPLTRFALCAWQFLLEPADPPVVQHQVPPDGTTNLVLIRSEDGGLYPRLVGPSLAAFAVPVVQGWSYAGVRLRPEAARAVIGIDPQAAHADELAPDGPFAPILADLADLIGAGTDWQRTRSFFAGLTPVDAAIAAAVDRMIGSGGTLPVARLAALAQLSERQFRRRFHAATGITPKQYADVQRVRRALIISLDDGNWAGIAHDSGFADQPHLARDIKERFGASPRRVAGYLGGIRHELVDHRDVRNLQSGTARAA